MNDFLTPTLDALFESYGYIDPTSAPPLPETDDDYLTAMGAIDDPLVDCTTATTPLNDLFTTLADICPATTSKWVTNLSSHLDDRSLLVRTVDDACPSVKALHGLDFTLAALGQSRREFYQTFRCEHPDFNRRHHVQGHLDGGAMATTTNRLHLLWHVEDIPHRSVILKVADNHPHYPQKQGYLCVPTPDTSTGTTLVPCYFTPSLPATIISPDAAGRALGCHGYTSLSLFDTGNCEVRLVQCRNFEQDVIIPATLQRGLLFTSPLIPPSRASDRRGPRPAPRLHVRSVTFGPTVRSPPPASTSSACACARPSSDPPCCSSGEDSVVPGEDSPPSDELQAKLLYYQRLGYQRDVSIDQLSTAAIGVPLDWTSPSMFCGSASTSSCQCSLPSSNLPSGSSEGASPSSGADSGLAGEDPSSFSEETSPSPPSTFVPPPVTIATPPTYEIAHLTRDQLRILWHQRLGHLHSRRVSEVHRHAHGVPNVPIATELDKCPVCLHSKLRKAARGKLDTRRATECFQGVSVDYGFLVQASADSTRMDRLKGLEGQTCYCLIVDHHSGTIFGETFTSKEPPLDFLNRSLAKYALPRDHPDTYVRFDLGGELGHSPAVVSLFEEAGYKVEPTGANASYQNALCERVHQTIGDALRAMLAGANLPPKFWPYAFHHHLRLYNITVHRDRDKSPYEICTGEKPDLSPLRVFGCRVYALPSRPRRPDKALSDARTGIFLGFAKTTKNVLYFDTETHTVKTCPHVAFDEAMLDLPFSERNFNARLLHLKPDSSPAETLDTLEMTDSYPSFDISLSPFSGFQTVTVNLDVHAELPLGFSSAHCSRLHCAFIDRVVRAPIGRTLRSFKRLFRGSYLVKIHNTPVFSDSDVTAALQALCQSPDPPSTIEVVLAPEAKTSLSTTRASPLHLRLSDLRRIHAIQAASGEDNIPTDEFRAQVDSLFRDAHPHEVLDVIEQLDFYISLLQVDAMTPEERTIRRKKACSWLAA